MMDVIINGVATNPVSTHWRKHLKICMKPEQFVAVTMLKIGKDGKVGDQSVTCIFVGCMMDLTFDHYFMNNQEVDRKTKV